MNQIIHLSKAKLLNTLPINDLCGNNKQKRYIAVLFIVMIVYMAINIGSFSVTTTINLMHAELVEYVYASLLSLTSIVLITLLLFTLNALLFEGNDYEMLQSLPVSQRDIIASKLLIVYIFSFCFACVMMLPGMVVHVLSTHAYIQFVFGIVSLVFVPVMPIGIAIIFGVGILYVASFAKHTTVLKILLSVLLFIGLMIGIYLLQSVDGLSTVMGLQMLRIYPPSLIFLKSNILYACMSFVVSMLIFYMLTWKYEVLHKLSTKHRVIYHDATFKHHSVFHALYQKELKRFFGSYLAVINQGFGVIMLVTGSVLLVLVPPTILFSMLKVSQIPVNVVDYIPLVIAGMLAFTFPSASSLSLEGKNLWIIQTAPIKMKDIIFSKISVTLSLHLIGYVCAIIAVFLRFSLSVEQMITVLLIPLAYSIFTAILGFALDYRFANYSWDNEVVPIKQNLQVGLTMLVSLFMVVLPILLSKILFMNLYFAMYLVASILFVVSVILFVFLSRIRTLS
jgi:ABC transporter permease protein